MHVRISPLLPIAFLVIWAITCVCTFLFATTSVVLDFAYFVLPFSAWVAPLCFAQLTCLLVSSNKNSPPARKPAVVLSVATFALAVAAYVLSIVVISRFLELPWRLGKFGEPSLSLGKPDLLVVWLISAGSLACLRMY